MAMGKKIVVVNAGPRKGWNTDKLISEAAKGAESAGAEILCRLQTMASLTGNGRCLTQNKK